MLLLAAFVLAFIAGFSLQRGGICAVIAVKEVLADHDWSRFLSFLECSAWACGGLLIANALGWMAIDAWPQQPSLAMATLGGAVFGAGALLNGACAFGSAGRFAAGEISFLALIPGFVAGVALAMSIAGAAHIAGAPVQTVQVLWPLLACIALFALLRLWSAWRAAPSLTSVAEHLRRPCWPAPLAMSVMAFANIGLLLILFAWPYTTLIVDVAFMRGMDVFLRSLIVVVFLAGASIGAVSAGRFKLRAVTWPDLAVRFFGGVLIGFGAALIPGGNDALVLLGLPLLQPGAFVAYAAMVAVIAAGFLLRPHFQSSRRAV